MQEIINLVKEIDSLNEISFMTRLFFYALNEAEKAHYQNIFQIDISDCSFESFVEAYREKYDNNPCEKAKLFVRLDCYDGAMEELDKCDHDEYCEDCEFEAMDSYDEYISVPSREVFIEICEWKRVELGIRMLSEYYHPSGANELYALAAKYDMVEFFDPIVISMDVIYRDVNYILMRTIKNKINRFALRVIQHLDSFPQRVGVPCASERAIDICVDTKNYDLLKTLFPKPDIEKATYHFKKLFEISRRYYYKFDKRLMVFFLERGAMFTDKDYNMPENPPGLKSILKTYRNTNMKVENKPNCPRKVPRSPRRKQENRRKHYQGYRS